MQAFMPGAQLRVLVIDDDPGTLLTYRAILRLAGYEVATASSGGEGLALLKSNDDFRLILVDLRLPDMSGLEVLAEVSTSQPDVPVVMISAWRTEASELASKRLGAVHFFDKSIDPDDLVEMVQRNLRKAQIAATGLGDALRMPLINHAAIRWATVIVPLTQLKADPTTIAEWGARVGKAPATLKVWCAAAGVHAGDSLDFARLLRVVTFYAGRHCDWHNVLAIIDSRTLARLLERGGLFKSRRVPDLDTYLRNQRFIAAPALLAAVRALLDSPT